MASRSRAADGLALVPAAALPLLFLHARYQPEVTLGPLNVYASDVAVLCVVLAALAAAVLHGRQPVWRPWPLWAAAAALLALFAVACFWRTAESRTDDLVTAAKFAEYALLAPALVLLFRRRAHVERFVWVFVAWATAASGWAVLQFLAVVNEFEGRRPGQLEPSFLGNVDFAATAGALLAIGVAGVALGRSGALYPVAVVAGVVGVAIAAQVLTYGGVLLMALACLALGRRARTLTRARVAIVVVATVLAGVGVLALRSYDTANFLRFLGIKPTTANANETVQTSSQRTMLGYIGLRIWLDHPLLGVGFERSDDRYQPYLADAKRKFPQAAYAFPSPAHKWGVQDLWIQLLADTGILGFALGVALFATALAIALRARPPTLLLGTIALGWVLVAVGAWTGMGIVAGIPLDAVTWLGFGLGAVAAGGIE